MCFDTFKRFLTFCLFVFVSVFFHKTLKKTTAFTSSPVKDQIASYSLKPFLSTSVIRKIAQLMHNSNEALYWEHEKTSPFCLH